MSFREHAVGLGLRRARVERWERRLEEAGQWAQGSSASQPLDARDEGLLEFVELCAGGLMSEDASNEHRAAATRSTSAAVVIHVGTNARIEVVRVDDSVAAFVARILVHSARLASDEGCSPCS